MQDLVAVLGEDRQNPDTGDLVVYFRDDGPVAHAGVVSGELVVSKWAGGAVWKHGVFEIPLGYGSRTKYYRSDQVRKAISTRGMDKSHGQTTVSNGHTA